jgi:hypothetical protein
MRRRGLLALLLLAGLTVSACSTSRVSPDSGSAQAQIDDVYAVYSTLTNSWGPRRDLYPDVKVRVVMKDHTEAWKQGSRWAGPTPCVPARGEHADQLSEALVDYETANLSAISLAERFSGVATVRVGTKEDVDLTRVEQAKHDSPGWLIVASVSAVGFSRDREVAVLSYSQSCGSTCGGTGFAVFARSQTGWQVIPRVVQCFTMS